LKIENNLTDYLSCCVLENEARSGIFIIQPHLINNLIHRYGDGDFEKRVYKKTTGTPRFKNVCPDDDSELIDADLHKIYCFEVGILLYLTKTRDLTFIMMSENFQSA
jgi:hypothetical protein